MAYSGGYNFVIDSSFTPMSLQEMLVPFTAYKDAFEKTEEAYVELSDKSNKFKYLSEQLPEGSKARQIYEGYADTLASQAEDLARNGLTAGNKRALTSLKRRYSGEIGRLEKADEALQKEKEMRRARGLQDSSMLYAIDNMGIDDFLDGNTPNLYGISGTELYTRGAAAGKAASSRVFSAGEGGKTLGGYFRDYVQKMGYNAETIARFRQDASAIPELQRAAEDILAERGVLDNLSGAALARARQSVINGIIDGAVYSEQHSPQRDPGVMGAAELDASRRGWAGLAQSESHFQQEMAYKRAALAATLDENGKKAKSGSGSDPSTQHFTQSKEGTRISWRGNDPASSESRYMDHVIEAMDLSKDKERPGTAYRYKDLPEYAKRMARTRAGSGNVDYYDYYFQPFENGWLWGLGNDTEAELVMIPRDIVVDDRAPALNPDMK
jgi:hypothetical protein